MKFLAAFTLLVAAGVTAQDNNCEAAYIVSRCLKTETDKVTACSPTDFNCLCAAYQAVATCYNNCPNDTRGPSAQANVTAYCRNVTITTASSHATSASASSSSSIATKLDAAPPTSTGFVSGTATPTSGSSAGRAAGGGMVVVAGIAGALAWL